MGHARMYLRLLTADSLDLWCSEVLVHGSIQAHTQNAASHVPFLSASDASQAYFHCR